jgi:adenylate cyclase class IV
MFQTDSSFEVTALCEALQALQNIGFKIIKQTNSLKKLRILYFMLEIRIFCDKYCLLLD